MYAYLKEAHNVQVLEVSDGLVSVLGELPHQTKTEIEEAEGRVTLRNVILPPNSWIHLLAGEDDNQVELTITPLDNEVVTETVWQDGHETEEHLLPPVSHAWMGMFYKISEKMPELELD